MKKKASKNRLIFFGSISIFIIVFFTVSFFSYVIEVKNLNQKQIELEHQLLAKKEEESNLKTEIEKLKNPEYLARYARENYMYSKDGEYVIKLDEEKKEQNNIIEKEDVSIIFISGGIITFIFASILIIKKIFTK